MSQMMVTPRTSNLIHDVIFSEHKSCIPSSSSPVCCRVCGKGLEDGFSLTAKNTPLGTILFCNVHY